jgi:hypothetical protein
MQRCVRLLTLSLVAGVLCLTPVGLAQPPTEAPSSPEVLAKQTILLEILSSIAQLEQELKAKQQEWRSPQGAGRKEELTQEIQQIGTRLKVLRDNLNYNTFVPCVTLWQGGRVRHDYLS